MPHQETTGEIVGEHTLGTESIEPAEEGVVPEVQPRTSARLNYVGDPTLGAVMRRPKWILALLLALAVAGGFAWLGQWQLGHAITLQDNNAADSEVSRPLQDIAEPGTRVRDDAAGMVLSTTGRFVTADFDIVEQRVHEGETGAWVVGHLVADDEESPDETGGHLAVAIGWAPTVEDAQLAASEFAAIIGSTEVHIEGRYLPADAAIVPQPDQDPSRVLSLVPGHLINLWQPFEGSAYAGYLVLHPAASTAPADSTTLAAVNLKTIESFAPLPVETINWLNLFYAAEWVVFAGFAVYFWYRLARDNWEREHELKLLQLDDE